MDARHDASSNIKLLDSFYRIFLILALVFLCIGVPFVFYRKLVTAILTSAQVVIILSLWRLSRSGKPELSLKLFASFMWVLLVGLIFFGLPPITVATAVAIAMMLCIVTSIQLGTLFIATYMLAWGSYIVLSKLGLAPEPYFINRPAVSWFIAAFAAWLVLVPLPGLVRSLRKANSLQRATIEATADGILVVSGGKVEICNRRFIDMWRIPPAALAPDSDDVLLNTVIDQVEDAQAFLAKVQYLYEHPDMSSNDIVRLKDGRIFERNSLPQRLDGKVVGRVWSFSDITASKRAEEELRIVATAFESQEAIMITDAEQVILRVNHAFIDNTGYDAHEAVGKTASTLLRSDRHDDAFYTAVQHAIQRTSGWQGEVWCRRKNGDIFPNWTTVTAVKGNEGQTTHYVFTQTDITSRKSAEEEIRHLAFYDPLTQLPNRRLLMDRLRQGLAASARSGHEGALMFIDLDNFKILNDTLGHDNGDALLRQVAERLPWSVRNCDTIARLGGDEFVVMLEDLSANPAEAAIQAEAVGEKIIAALNQPYHLVGHQYHCTPSIGVALFGAPMNSVEEVMKRADLAMYEAKAAGRNCLRFFDPEMQSVVTAHAQLEEELRQALDLEEFRLFYQPQVDDAGRLTGAEALVRWQHPQRGLVGPLEFIPLSEQTAIILPLGRWVLEAACKQLVAWAGVAGTAHLTVAVNVSARQFRERDFVAQVKAVLDKTGAKPQRLKLELTESILLDDVEDVITKMTQLRAHGVGFSLDDFGTGYSSLSYLRRLPLDQLKIDRSFVRDVLTNPHDAAIVRTIVGLGKNLDMKVIAEGVETEVQWRFLQELGCHAYQGYFFGRPVPISEFGRASDQRYAAGAA
ncbi:PAS domain S-box-containing protein/diguanylate cyclase (GGDEF)-like protein [Paucimonas lemoignei]|uniref:PAS domain S-box-containing protein/diguanylate cyclase (GGDEF)-like protein n=1 Tax=Paucimonas lemoignei TaxID=29443 RepID=A0A4R3HUQ8_PAULE|nr:bifunctional diguanylate cyclase/phosphodiesterase [Paucimonas lemoignei]TCS33747.1 PAS domain S-box-containing protein/diguanylate cyclase (GGDEF)-like protein [Paucimonas lemoignei]